MNPMINYHNHRTLIVIGGGLFQTFAIKKAKELGYSTICVDMNPNASGAQLADVFLNISTRDHKSICKALKDKGLKVKGVITVGTDMSETVYHVSKEFGLDPGFSDPLKVVNKIEMRKALKKSNVLQPDFVYSDELDDILKKRKEDNLSFPLVLKPSQSMGARGVKKVENDYEIREQFQICKDFSSDKRVILEEYMEGPEVSVESIMIDGNYNRLVIGDRHIEKEPYFIETGHSCPSTLSDKVQKNIDITMEKAAKALEIYNSPAKGDIKITEKGIMVGEIAARLSGGFMSSHTLPLSTGIDAISLAVLQRLGKKIEVKQTLKKYPVCIERAIYSEIAFVIKKISGQEKVEAIKGVEYFHLNLKEGDKVNPLTSNIGKIANIIIVSEDREKAEKIFEEAKKELIIDQET